MRNERYDAVVVGAGPNGLAAAICLARAGRSVLVVEAHDTVGGGCRTAELTLPGFRHDVCSAIHPFAVGAKFLPGLPLEEHGLEWVWPEVQAAQPLDGGRGGVVLRDLDATAAQLGDDAATYRRLIGPIVRRWDDLAEQLLGPLRIPRHPFTLARFGLRALRSATGLADSFQTPEARALLGGMAAHSVLPLDRPTTGAFALIFTALGHSAGWPMPEGGAQSLVDAMAAYLRTLGGEIATGVPVRHIADLPRTSALVFDTTPGQVESIAGGALTTTMRRRLRRFRHGPGVFKLDYALDGPVPWTHEPSRRAGTVHIGGTIEEVAAAEREVAEGRHPERPFLLVAQNSVADPTRAPAGQHTLWVYTHVPNGSTVDMTAAIESQLERFAPGFRDLVLARHVTTPADLEAYNPNYPGGDISAGSHDGLQLFARPVVSLDPYRVGARVWICSASTPPGAGVHGMCGYHAAGSILRATE